MPLRIPGIDAEQLAHSRVLEMPLAAARQGILLHYDDSRDDRWSLRWFQHPDCKNGYTWLVMDDGRLVELADPARRTPHAGKCVTPNANSVFYGLCIATNGRVPATSPQLERVIAVTVAVFRHHGWYSAAGTRIRGHHEERVYTAADTPKRALWGKLGAKLDPIGRDPKNPVLDPDVVREAVMRELHQVAPR